MNNIGYWGWVSILSLMLAFAPLAEPQATLAGAAELKPVAVVSITKVDRLMTDIGYLTRAVGMPKVRASNCASASSWAWL